jgi:hypothetical protein
VTWRRRAGGDLRELLAGPLISFRREFDLPPFENA